MQPSRLTLAALASALLLCCAYATPARAAAPPAADGAFVARIQERIAAMEYEATLRDGAWQAPNRANELRTWFAPTGIRVQDRSGGARLVELSLARVGRGAAMRKATAGALDARGARVEIRREDLVEWYVNAPAGLEQGFTIAKRPAPRRAGDLVLELDVAGASVAGGGDALVLRPPTGRALRYGKLAAKDAKGRALPARLEAVAPDRIRLVVADRGAAYPVVIDPLLEATADAVLTPGASAVASAGDVNGDGYADVIVGNAVYDGGQPSEGAAFVFLGSAAGIPSGDVTTAQAKLEANLAGAGFGASVASAGDVNGDGYDDVIVGAPSYGVGSNDTPPYSAGAAFVFLGSASGIVGSDPTTAATRIAADAQAGDLGSSVASAGDVNGDGYDDVVVGAPEYGIGPDGFGPRPGGAFVFLGSAGGIADADPGTAHARIVSSEDAAFLGTSVAAAGDVDADGYGDVLIGAPNLDGIQVNGGAALLFRGSAAGIATGDETAASARLESDESFTQLGQSVAGAGDVNHDGYDDVIVGAPGYDAGQANEGAAFVFLGSAAGIADGNPATANAQLEANRESASFGSLVASAGDANGDGYDDVIATASGYPGFGGSLGAAFVFLGSASGVADGNPATAAAQLNAIGPVAPAGDIDGDGDGEVLVAAPGRVEIYLGSPGRIAAHTPATADARLASGASDAEFATSVASADVNGDGYDDVIVGEPFFDAGNTDEGAAFVFMGIREWDRRRRPGDCRRAARIRPGLRAARRERRRPRAT